MDDYMTIADVAAYTGLKEKSIRNYTGTLLDPARREPMLVIAATRKGKSYFERKEVERWWAKMQARRAFGARLHKTRHKA